MTDKVHDPIHRCAMSFRREGDDLWVETWLEPGGHLPEHFHPSLEEHWEVLEGEARVKLAGAWRTLSATDGPVVVARDVRHELRNESGRQVHLRCRAMPAGRLDEFLTETARGGARGSLQRPQHAHEHQGRGLALTPRARLQGRDGDLLAAPGAAEGAAAAGRASRSVERT